MWRSPRQGMNWLSVFRLRAMSTKQLVRLLLVALTTTSSGVCSITYNVVTIDDSTGSPVANTRICWRQSHGGECHEVIADRAGRVELAGIRDGQIALSLRHPRYVPVSIVLFPQGDNSQSLTVRLIRLGVVSGTLLGTDGTPLRNARIAALADFGGFFRRAGNEMSRTDAAGQYRVYDLPIGQYAVAALVPSDNRGKGLDLALFPGSEDSKGMRLVAVRAGEVQTANIMSPSRGPTYNISGSIRQSEVAHGLLTVKLISADFPNVALSTIVTDGSERFTLADVPSGHYELLAFGPRAFLTGIGSSSDKAPWYARRRVDVTASDVDIGDLELQPGGTMKISLSPPPGSNGDSDNDCGDTVSVALRFEAASERDVVWAGQLVAHNPIQLFNLPPGVYSFSMEGNEGRCYLHQSGNGDPPDHSIPFAILPPGGNPIDFKVELRPGIRLPVWLADQQETVGLFAGLIQDPPCVDRCSVFLSSASPDNSFLFDSLRPGSYRLGIIRSDVALRAGSQPAEWLQRLTVPIQITTAASDRTIMISGTYR